MQYIESVASAGQFIWGNRVVRPGGKASMRWCCSHPITTTIASVAMVIISSPALLVGACLSKAAQIIKGEDASFQLKGEGVEAKGITTFLSLNCNGIAGSRVFDGRSERFSRLKPLAEKIKSYIKADEPFVFVGQECFGYFAHVMWDAFKDISNTGVIRGGGKIFGMENGLVCFTNKKIKQVAYRTFSHQKGLSRSGIAHGFQIIEFEDGQILCHTHFDKGTDLAIKNQEKLDELHHKALDETKAQIAIMDLSGRAIILAGDLNNEKMAKEYWRTAQTTCTNQGEVDIGSAHRLQVQTLDVLHGCNGEDPEVFDLFPLTDHSLLRAKL